MSYAGARCAPVSPQNIEILVVESNPTDTLLTKEAFKAAGLTGGLRSVTDGEDAMMYVHRKGKYANVKSPDVIFLDLSQPRISGLGVLKAIKSTPELMHIPIVVAAGSDDPDFIRAVYALNGNCFIRKPTDLGQFLHFVECCYEFWSAVVTLSPRAGARAHKATAPSETSNRISTGTPQSKSLSRRSFRAKPSGRETDVRLS
jgi:chemotaxis family two-component system response regulator Rcp1